MKINLHNRKQWEQGSIIIFVIFLLVLLFALAQLAVYVTQMTKMQGRRNDTASAQQYAEAGAVIACSDFEAAFTNQASSLGSNLVGSTVAPYKLNSALSTNKLLVYERTISSPFTNQTVFARITVTNTLAPQMALIDAAATVGQVTQHGTVNLQMAFGAGAAIVSVNAGTTSTGVSKSDAQAGNVVVNGGGSGSSLVVDGGKGLAILANGEANVSTTATVPASSVSSTNWGSGNQVPDYTSQGTANSLFDFNRFIAVADASNNHYTNVADFITAAQLGTVLEGVVVVDIPYSQKSSANFSLANLPLGINIRGTLFVNFTGVGWTPTDKIISTAAININPANLTGVVASNPSTYTTGYPPTYTNPAKNPINVDISSKGFANFMPGDDLPAYMSSIGELDMHGPLNICGVVYTPSYMEVENKANNQTQYIRGSVIVGDGIYCENTSSGAKSIISYDPAALNFLATQNTKGKTVKVAYWQ
jgi:hypothetical protein